MKKLYRVNVKFTYYALAYCGGDARSYAFDAAQDVSISNGATTSLVGSEGKLVEEADTFVYGSDDELTLDEALKACGLPTVKERV